MLFFLLLCNVIPFYITLLYTTKVMYILSIHFKGLIACTTNHGLKILCRILNHLFACSFDFIMQFITAVNYSVIPIWKENCSAKLNRISDPPPPPHYKNSPNRTWDSAARLTSWLTSPRAEVPPSWMWEHKQQRVSEDLQQSLAWCHQKAFLPHHANNDGLFISTGVLSHSYDEMPLPQCTRPCLFENIMFWDIWHQRRWLTNKPFI